MEEKQIHSLHHDPFFEGQYSRNRLNSANGSIANIDQHKILLPVTPNTLRFAEEANSPFILWPRDSLFEGQ